MFKSGHYYKVTHFITCIIKVIDRSYEYDLWNIKIIKILKSPYSEPKYKEGLSVNWYESWCTDVKEITDELKLLAIVL